MSVTGPPGTGPSRVGIAISDTASGTVLTQGVLAALIARERTGRGQWVHTSLLETMVNFMDFQAARWLIDGEVPGQTGNHHPTIVPMGTFPTADGYAQRGAHRRLPRLLRARRRARARRRSALRRLRVAVEHRAALDAAIAEVIRAAHHRRVGRNVLAGVMPCGPVLAIDEVFADPQVEHLHLTRPVEHPTRGDIEVLRPPLTFSETPATHPLGSARRRRAHARGARRARIRRRRDRRARGQWAWCGADNDPRDSRSRADDHRRHRHREDARPRGGRHRLDDLQQPGAPQRDVVRDADRGAAHPRRVREPTPTCT